ncbi:MAG: hypothetical protein M3Z54_05755 [Gemmatimonadota bacterium]|nr:hypothetical protein [Gemmatimonadota bacterium]
MRMVRIAGIALLLGCGGSADTTAVAVSIVGTWNARTIDGVPLPAPDQYSQTLSDKLVVNSGGSYVETQVYELRTSASGWTTPITSTDPGAWGGFGNAFHFRPTAANALTPDSQAVFDGTTLRVSWEIETSSGPIVQVFAYTQ